MAGDEGPHLVLVEPRHPRAHQHTERHGCEDQRRDEKRAAEASDQILALGDLRGVNQRRKARLEIAHDHVGHERRHDEHGEDSHDRDGLRDRERRVDVDVAFASDLNLIDGHRAEGEQEEDRAADGKQRRAQLVADFEDRDVRQHGVLPCARTSGAAAVLAQGREIQVFERGGGGLETRAWRSVREHVELRAACAQARAWEMTFSSVRSCSSSAPALHHASPDPTA